jgi:hypothetical protein
MERSKEWDINQDDRWAHDQTVGGKLRRGPSDRTPSGGRPSPHPTYRIYYLRAIRKDSPHDLTPQFKKSDLHIKKNTQNLPVHSPPLLPLARSGSAAR